MIGGHGGQGRPPRPPKQQTADRRFGQLVAQDTEKRSLSKLKRSYECLRAGGSSPGAGNGRRGGRRQPVPVHMRCRVTCCARQVPVTAARVPAARRSAARLTAARLAALTSTLRGLRGPNGTAPLPAATGAHRKAKRLLRYIVTSVAGGGFIRLCRGRELGYRREGPGAACSSSITASVKARSVRRQCGCVVGAAPGCGQWLGRFFAHAGRRTAGLRACRHYVRDARAPRAPRERGCAAAGHGGARGEDVTRPGAAW